MKILKIENERGYVIVPTNGDSSKKKIEEVTKEDILTILKYMINNEIEMDEVTEKNDLINPVQKLVYSELYNQFINFKEEKEKIIKEVDSKFIDAEKKYLK